MTIEQWPADKVMPYAKNPRVIPAAAVDKVAASIREFGWRQPIVIDEQAVIIAGHTRLLAARKLGLQTIPVHVAEGLTARQVRALRLMDNRSHDESTWNIELLAPEMLELQQLNVDLGLTGFNPSEIDRLIGLSGAVSDDLANAVPDLPVEAVSAVGDLWKCGPHRCFVVTQRVPKMLRVYSMARALCS